MPFAERLGSVTGVPVCDLSMRWGISGELAERLTLGADHLEFPVAIISGLRTEAQQDALRRDGNPAADNDRSTHLSCPATGADVWPQITIVPAVKGRLGAEMVLAGLRWGGGSQLDESGMPSDWNHFDLGPRQ